MCHEILGLKLNFFYVFFDFWKKINSLQIVDLGGFKKFQTPKFRIKIEFFCVFFYFWKKINPLKIVDL